MPSVYNGCGTWYHFKKNHQRVQGVCSQCGAHTQLTSYDTWLCVVIVFIPIIPLGKKRIVNECAHCRRHMMMPWADYSRLKERAQAAQAALEASPRNAEHAKDALTACVPMRDCDQFLRIAPIIEQNQADQPESLALLAASHEVFGQWNDVERVLRLSLVAKDEADVRERLAQCLMNLDRPDEAEEYLAHIVRDAIPDRVGCLYELAQMFQIKGQHEKAIAYFDHCTDIQPAMEQDQLFCRLREASHKALGTSTPVKPMQVVKQMQSREKLRKFGRFAAVAACVALAGYLILCGYIGRHRTIYLVSGVDRQYSATVDGRSYLLSPFGTQPVKLAEGRHTIAATGLANAIAPQEFEVHTPFLIRPFAGKTFVVNPDRCAVLVLGTIYYAADRSRAPEGQDETSGGQLLATLPDVDYPFQPFPQTLRVDSRSSSVKKTRVCVAGQEGKVDRGMMLLLYQDNLPAATLGEIAMRRVEYEGPNEPNMGVAARLLGPEKTIAFLRQGLSRRPIDLTWHRHYQAAMEDVGKGRELEEEYEQYLQQMPDDPSLLYLRGRCCSDPERALTLLEKAAGASSPCTNAYSSLAWRYIGQGQFEKALEQLAKLPKPTPLGQRDLLIKCLWALEHHKEAVEVAHAWAGDPYPTCIAGLQHEVALRGARLDHAGAEASIARVLDPIAPRGHKSRKEIDALLFGELQYCMGNVPLFAEIARQSEQPVLIAQAALTQGKLQDAEAAMAKHSADGKADLSLVFYIAAVQQHDEARAAKYLSQAIGRLRKQDAAHQRFADAMEQGNVSWTELAPLAMDLAEKRIVAVAVGLRRPELREPAFALARKLNFDRRFPYLLLRSCLDDRGN